MTQLNMKINGGYKWKGQSELIVYVGMGTGGSRGWHQFELVDNRGIVWCEVLADDLHLLEERI